MLLEDEATFDAYFHTMPQALELQQAYEQRLKSNIALAGRLSLFSSHVASFHLLQCS